MLKVLLVDDQRREIEGIANLLPWESMGIELVGTADNGREGLALARRLAPDIIITDIIMPDMDGLAMLDAINQSGLSARIICISCFDDFKFVSIAMNKGASGYVLKPILANELEAVVKRVADEAKEAKRHRELDQRFGSLLSDDKRLKEGIARQMAAGNLAKEDICAMLKAALWPDAFLAAALPDFADAARRDLGELLGSTEATLFAQGRYLLILFPLRGHSDADACRSALKCALDTLQEQHGMMLYAGLAVPSSAEGVHRAFDDARMACDLSFSRRAGSLSVWDADYKGSAWKPAAFAKEMQALLLLNDIDKMRTFIEKALPGEHLRADLVRRAEAMLYLLYTQSAATRLDGGSDADFARVSACVNRGQLIDTMLEIFDECDAAAHAEGDSARAVTHIKQYIGDHLAEQVKLEEMLEGLYISPGHANVLFKAATGSTIHQYIGKQRLAIAADMLLSNPRVKVYEIAWKVGFNDAAYFVNVFRRAYHCTPAQYRASAGKGV